MTSRQKSGLTGTVLFCLFGLFVLTEARHAEMHNQLLPGESGEGWMSPLQAYIVAFLCFAAAAYSIYLGFRRTDR